MTIRMDSIEAQIIADGLESGLSLKSTWRNVNKHRDESNQELVSESCVAYALRKMKPKLIRIKKRKQGSTDPNSNWSKARHLWCIQLLIRFGELKLDDLYEYDELQRSADRFNRELIGELELNQVVWWDETHRKCLIGGSSSTKNYQMLFQRDRNGRIDLVNGNYSEERKTILNVKYEKECRVGLGCAMIQPKSSDGTLLPAVGVRCNLFDYTSKTLISIDDYDKMVKIEIARVKALQSTKLGFWIESAREEGKFYLNDKLTVLKQCAQKTAEKLFTVGLQTVGDLMDIDVIEDFPVPEKMTFPAFKKLWMQAKTNGLDEFIPPTVDHRAATNPYESKYGDSWEQHIQTSAAFSHVVCITKYITHIMVESERVMKGTAHENTWMVYHDALSLMTAKRTKEWMREKNYLKRWILPTENLFDDLPAVKAAYKQNPIGNSPELMPWDAHLNQDVHSSHDFHAIVTQKAAEEDERKFSSSTPARLLASYRRLLHPETGVVPSSDRIMQDISRVILSLKEVRAKAGCIIDEKSIKRDGRRRQEVASDQCSWGGKRNKKTQQAYRDEISGVLHPDAIALRNSGLEHSVQVFERANIQDNDNNNSEIQENNMENMQNNEQEIENSESDAV